MKTLKTFFQNMAIPPAVFLAATFTLTLAANSVSDAASNTGPASEASVSGTTAQAPDTIAPRVRFRRPVDGLIGIAQDHTITFTEAVTGLEVGDFNASGAVVNSIAPPVGPATTYTITFTPSAASFTLVLAANSVSDLVGNEGPMSSVAVSGTATPDITPPTVTFGTITPGVIGIAQLYQFTFNEVITGLATSDFSASGATVSGVSGSGRTYTITFTPTLASFTLTLAANSVTDLAPTPNSGPGSDASVTGSAVGIFNLDGDGSSVSIKDAKFLYYAHALEPALNNSNQATVLGPLTSAEDDELGNLLTAARGLLSDLNGDGDIDDEDAAVFYYSFALEDSLGDGNNTRPGILEIKKAILGPLVQNPDDINAINQMLQRIYTLRGE